jgi:hypothetical protein
MICTYIDVALLSHPILAFLSIQHPKMHAKPSMLQYFAFSFLSLLALRYASSNYFERPAQFVASVCISVDQPNPVASIYPNNATGTLNGTLAVLPITLELARLLIPSQYGILEHAYRALLPSFPRGMYPAIAQALHDHEVQAFGYKIDDFTVSCPRNNSHEYEADEGSVLELNFRLSTYSTTTRRLSNGHRHCLCLPTTRSL